MPPTTNLCPPKSPPFQPNIPSQEKYPVPHSITNPLTSSNTPPPPIPSPSINPPPPTHLLVQILVHYFYTNPLLPLQIPLLVQFILFKKKLLLFWRPTTVSPCVVKLALSTPTSVSNFSYMEGVERNKVGRILTTARLL